MKRFVITRYLSKAESCADRPLEKGDTVLLFTGCTYGCISPEGTACCDEPNGPFFEVPTNALAEVNALERVS